MNKLITFENLSTFCYCNYNLCKLPVRGIVLSFRGLGSMKAFTDESPEVAEDAARYGEHGILYIKPNTNPWSWMNRQAVAVTDEILDVVFDHFKLPETTPIVSTGGSMGGQQALVYMLYAKRTPIACAVNCAVCDMPYHYTERPDLPRSMYSAFYEEEGDIFYEDLSGHILQDDKLVRLIAMPNVIVTSHQAFLTTEALDNIASTTVNNLVRFFSGHPDTGTEVVFQK